MGSTRVLRSDAAFRKSVWALLGLVTVAGSLGVGTGAAGAVTLPGPYGDAPVGYENHECDDMPNFLSNPPNRIPESASYRWVDMDKDGRPEYFTYQGSAGTWTTLETETLQVRTYRNSGVALRNLRFADLDGNGKTDVWRKSGNRVMVSWDGTSSWKKIFETGADIDRLHAMDVNLDGSDEILRFVPKEQASGRILVRYTDKPGWQDPKIDWYDHWQAGSFGCDYVPFVDVDGDRHAPFWPYLP